MRGDVMMNHPAKPILHFYKTIKNPFSVPVMALEEIMAEKIRAITYTKHPRHLYDIQYLHHQGVSINPDMVKTKIKSVYDEDFDLDKLKERLPEKAKDWMTALRSLLPTPLPSFDDVSKEVFEVITDAMK
ncbi:MAG: nucleotidyl transferase AbiEii/AbiGii toxin family protein [Thaumarchaeota archaeon]|nr:nucleotidyl transferase AbiEii/AbiGii toxin family protein [Nitrososphaerota archaeon]